MRIVASQVEAQSQHLFRRNEQRVEIRAGNGGEASQLRRDPPVSSPRPAAPTPAAVEEESLDPSDKLAVGVSLLKALVEAMTGKRIDTADFNGSCAASTATGTAMPPATASAASVSAVSISEYEYLDIRFSAQLQTADGSRLSIDLSFTMERSFQFQSVSARSGNATDPLLINFDGLGARLDGSTFQLDLNSDGSAENLASLAAGSAWLALDRNGNGNIDNGSELFGPASGNGFIELAQYDEDGNGFIDEGDSVFSQLQLFRPDSPLAALASADVGAIFLGAVDSPFRFSDAADRTLAQLRATSFYVGQNGGGLVQQLDLTA